MSIVCCPQSRLGEDWASFFFISGYRRRHGIFLQEFWKNFTSLKNCWCQ
jgi:hypothetical protein